MADHGVETEDRTISSSCDLKKISGGPSYPCQSNWMSRWIGTARVQASFVNKHAPSIYAQEKVGCMPKRLESGPHMSPSVPRKRVGKEIEAGRIGFHNESMATKSGNEIGLNRGNWTFSGKYITSPLSLKGKEIAASVSTEDTVKGSTSHTKVPIFNLEDAPTPSFQSHARSNTCLAEGCSSCKNNSSFLLQQKENEYKFKPAPTSKKHDPSPSGKSLPIILEAHQNMQHFSSQGIPGSVNNVHTMKICTGPPKFSQTTHHFLFTQKTDVNLSNEHEQLRQSTTSTQHKGLAFSQYFSLPPRPVSHRQQGVKIQPLWSSSESKEDPCSLDAKCESSAETDTMVIDSLQDKYVTFGVALSPKIKDSAGDLNLTITGVGSVKEKSRSRIFITEIPDINEMPPDLNVEPGSRHIEAISSRTQSLDVGNLLPHAGESCKSVSNPIQDHDLHLEPSSRWVKRLKLSPSDSIGIGTKSSNLPKPSSIERIMILKKLMMHKYYVQHQVTLDQCAEPSRNGERSSIAGFGRSQNGMLSHFWIRRWCRARQGTQEKNSQDVRLCEPESTKLGLDDLGKKPFPSIAAMALMGKAMKGFHPCELRRRGPVLVWSANDY